MEIKDLLKHRVSSPKYKTSVFADKHYGLNYNGKTIISAHRHPSISGFLILFDDCTNSIVNYETYFKLAANLPSIEESISGLNSYLADKDANATFQLSSTAISHLHTIIEALNDNKLTEDKL